MNNKSKKKKAFTIKKEESIQKSILNPTTQSSKITTTIIRRDSPHLPETSPTTFMSTVKKTKTSKEMTLKNHIKHKNTTKSQKKHHSMPKILSIQSSSSGLTPF